MIVKLLVVAMLTFNTHSQECSVRASYIVDQVQSKEVAIIEIAAKVPPSPEKATSHPKDARREPAFLALSTGPESVGHIDQHDYG